MLTYADLYDGCFTTALLLLYYCFTTALLLLYYCFTTAFLLLYCRFPRGRLMVHRAVEGFFCQVNLESGKTRLVTPIYQTGVRDVAQVTALLLTGGLMREGLLN
jgi:hypothetical protein